jgi:hypothetical protein
MDRRIAMMSVVLGASLMQVVGMSTSGVASTSRHAAVDAGVFSVSGASSVAQFAATKKPKVDPDGTAGGTQITKTATKQEARGLRALDLVSFDWKSALPGWRFRFLAARKGYLAITFREERRIDVYVRMDRSEPAIAHDIAHELGHAVDVTYLNDEDRQEILQIRRLPPATAWWAQTGAGDFAETFAMMFAPRVKFYSELGDEPTADELQKIESIVTAAIARSA